MLVEFKTLEITIYVIILNLTRITMTLFKIEKLVCEVNYGFGQSF